MENPSAPEKSSAERYRSMYVRPPGIEFAMGVALFAMGVLVLLFVQWWVLYKEAMASLPEFDGLPFSFARLNDPVLKEQMLALQGNGDVVARMTLWSGMICTLAIVLTAWLWKRRHVAAFLGLRVPKATVFLKWVVLFAALMIGLEIIMRLSTAFETDFMQKLLGSSTNKLLLFVAVGFIGPICEEFLLRGLLLGSIRHMADEHVAVALTAGVFAVMHLQYSWTIMLLILPMGVMLGYARVRSGSIWVPVLLHVVNNVTSLLFS